MREIGPRKPYPYVMGKYEEPLATVSPGETVALFTEEPSRGGSPMRRPCRRTSSGST
jgi:hypothetical protein